MEKTVVCALLVCGKILLFALLAVLVLVVLLLCARIGFRLRVHKDGAIEVLARVGVFCPSITGLAAWRAARQQKPQKTKLLRYTKSYGLFGEAPVHPTKNAKAKKADAHKKSPSKVSQKPQEKTDIPALLGRICDFLAEAFTLLSGDGRIRIRRLVLTAAGAEPSDTALLFGHMNTALALLLQTSDRFERLDTTAAPIGVYADFQAEAAQMDADIELNFRAWVLTRVAFDAAKTYLAVKKNV